MAKILSFGSLNIDYVYTLDHIVNHGETIASNNLELFCGGNGLNQSIALKKAGANVYHAGNVGKNGQMLLDALKAASVNVDNIEKLDVDNGHAIIQVDKCGENSIILHKGSNELVTRSHIDKTFENFSCGDFLVLQNEINNLQYIMEKAHEKGIKIVLNPSPITDEIYDLPLEYVDYFVLNEIEAKQILNIDDDEDLLLNFSKKFNKAHIVLTLGSKGSCYKYKDTMIIQDIFETKDTLTAKFPRNFKIRKNTPRYATIFGYILGYFLCCGKFWCLKILDKNNHYKIILLKKSVL